MISPPRYRLAGLLAIMACVAASSASARAQSVAVRAIGASMMTGNARVEFASSSPGGSEIVLGSKVRESASPTLLASKAIIVDLAGGCFGARLRIYVDGKATKAISAGTASWHAVTIARALTAGQHTLSLGASYLRRHRGCPATRVAEIDFVPADPEKAVLLGAAVRATNLSDPIYTSAFARYYGSLTPENEMKMEIAEPQEGQFAFGASDALVSFAAENSKRIRGHALVYGSQLPGWITNPLLPWTAETLLKVMQSYISTMMQRYAGRVGEWDVVNEAFNEDGTYNQNLWYRIIGPSYIADAFRIAHAADPSARLVYNDIGAEFDDAKFHAIHAMAATFVAQGVPIDAVGLQNHTNLFGYPTTAQLESTMRAYAQLGLGTEITEMDVGTSGYPGTAAQLLARQADAYRQAGRACWMIASCSRLTTWGFSDAVSWIGTAQAALPLNSSYQSKPAYRALVQALHLTS